MKKIIRTIKLRKFKARISEECLKLIEGKSFLIWYEDDTAKEAYCKEDLISELRKDHIKPIRYIFDMTDRIIVDRDIKIDLKV